MSLMNKTVIDKVTGFVGEVRAEAQYASGSEGDQSLVQPKCGNDQSKMPEAQWINNQRLVVDEETA